MSWQGYSYDLAGEQALEIDGGKVTTSDTYDGGNLTLQVVSGSGGVVSEQTFSYDEAGNTTLTVNGDGTTISDAYN